MRKVGRMAFELAGLPFHFRCHQMDDFGPAKNLMTMCFTYYHIGKARGRERRGEQTRKLKARPLVTWHQVRLFPISCAVVRLPENNRTWG